MTSRARLRLTMTLTALALLALGCAGGGGGGDQKIVIGVYGSMTGGDATFGQSTKTGFELALSELQTSQQGMIGGIRIESVVEDDQGRPEEAATVVQKLINQDRVACVVGEVASSRSLAAAPICQQNEVPMITPSSTNPRVTQVGDYIFRMCFLDDFQGESIARFAAENLKLKKVAVLKDVKNDYSVALAQYFTAAFAKLGGTVVVEQTYSSGDPDFRAPLTKIKARNPEALIVPGYYTEAGLIARQARELGITVPILGGDGWESEKLIEIGGEAMNGCYYTNHWSLDQPQLQPFVTAYRAKYQSEPDAIAGLAYDAGKVLFAALTKLATDDPAGLKALVSTSSGEARTAASRKLRDNIAATRGYAGVTGTISLDANRNAQKPIVVIEVKDGKKVFAASMEQSAPTP